MKSQNPLSRITRQSMKRQKGMSLVEIAIVIVIAAAVISAALVGVPQVLANQKASEAASEYPALFANVQRLYKSVNNYPAGAITAVVINNNGFPENRVTGKGTAAAAATSVWGTAVTVTGGGAQTATVTIAGVPNYECRELINSIQANARAVTVGATVVKAAGAAINTATLGTACENAADANNVIFTIGK